MFGAPRRGWGVSDGRTVGMTPRMVSADPPPPSGSVRRKVHEAAAGALTVTTVEDGESVVIAVYGEIDLGSIGAFEEAARHALAGGVPQVVVDLGACHFIDSTGLGALVALHREIRARGGAELLMLPGPRSVQRAFDVSGLSDDLPFAEA